MCACVRACVRACVCGSSISIVGKRNDGCNVFKRLSKVAKLVLLIPHSNANEERIFKPSACMRERVTLSLYLFVCHFFILEKVPFSGLKLTSVHSRSIEVL